MGASAAFAMLVLILDAKTALNGAYQGVHLCLYTVIPSLFPFFVVSILLTGCLTGLAIPILAPLERLCRLPGGSASILLTGLLGGYPIGAQATAQAYYQGSIAKEDAQRMLAFSSNAGPAFLFGLIGQQFTHPWMPWVLWLVHILSAITVGALLPGKHASASALPQKDAPDITEAVSKSIRVMAGVCGWIVVMRTVAAFLERWFFFLLPPALQVVVTGLLELTNGCVALPAIENEGMRAILCSGLLAFGGICVSLQTAAVTRGLSMRLYFPGKILQTSISLIFAWVSQYFIFSAQDRVLVPWWCYCIFVLPCIYLYLQKKKKVVAIP
jgi:hypothetical protein